MRSGDEEEGSPSVTNYTFLRLTSFYPIIGHAIIEQKESLLARRCRKTLVGIKGGRFHLCATSRKRDPSPIVCSRSFPRKLLEKGAPRRGSRNSEPKKHIVMKRRDVTTEGTLRIVLSRDRSSSTRQKRLLFEE